MITREQAAQYVAYNPDTGEFTRIKSAGRRVAGTIAGSTCAGGYRVVRMDRRDHYAHRLAFLFMTGEIPAIVDHINGDRADNRWGNLRASSKMLNAQNMKRARADNRLGLLGVCKSHQNDRYIASIRVGGRGCFLGEFDTAELAHAAYLEAKRALHEANTL